MAQPVGGSICTGGNFDLSVVASGSPDIHFQWQSFNGTDWINVGLDQPTHNTGVLTSTTTFRVFISADESGCEDVTSEGVVVTVTPDISIIGQPVGGSICEGGNFDLSVTASGSPNILYQWEVYNGASWITISGANSSGFNTGALSQSTDYRVLLSASESGCEDLFSEVVTVTVVPDILISVQPIGDEICVGGDATLSVTASGSPNIQFQWETFDGADWIAIPGATSSVFNTGALSVSTLYRVFVFATESGCEDVTSSEALVTVTPDISISGQPVGGSICEGGNFDLNVTASGSPDIHYQWEMFDGSDWVVVGADLAMYNTGVLTESTNFRVFVSADESGCEDVISNEVTVVVEPDIVISSQPDNIEECIGGNAFMSVGITGGSGTISYQWQASNDDISSSFVNIAGAITSSYTPPSSVAGTTYYRVLVNASGSGCDQSVSQTSTVIISPDLVIQSQPANITECIGGNGQIGVVVTGGSGITTYQWQYSTTNISANFADVVGETSSTYIPPSSVVGTTYYRVLVDASNNGCDEVISNVSAVVITPDLSIITHPNSFNECIGGTNQLSVISTGGSGAISYQWQSSLINNPGDFTDIPGALTQTYVPSSVSAGTTYYRVIIDASNSGCDAITSNVATVIIAEDISFITQPNDIEECIGGSDQLSASISGGSGVITYQWQVSSSFAGPYTNVSGGMNPTYTPPSTIAGTYYYRILANAANSGCDQAISQVATVIISPDILVQTQPGNISECIGGTNSLSVVATGGSGAISYQWQSSAVNTSASFTSISGAVNSSFTPPSIAPGTTYYRVLINASNSGCNQAVSLVSTVVITPDISFLTQPSNITECIGGNNAISVSITGGSGSLTYQWQSSPDQLSGNFVNVPTAIGSSYIPPSAISGTTYYRVLVNAANSGCDQAVSQISTVVITPDITITQEPLGIVECVGGSDSLTVSITGGSGTISHQWQVSPANDPNQFDDIPGATSTTYTPPSSIPGTLYYRVLVNASNSGCDQAVSAVSTVIISPDISISGQPQGGFICVGGDFDLSVAASGSPDIHYRWELFDGTNWILVGGDQSTYNTGTLSETTTYRVLVNADESGCEDVMSDEIDVVVTPDISISGQPLGGSVCEGGELLLQVGASGSPDIHYQWQEYVGPDWIDIGIDNADYSTGALYASTSYRVILSASESGCETVISDSIAVLVTPDIAIISQPEGSSICSGGTDTLVVLATGSPGLHYQWELWQSGAWQIVGTDNNTFITPALTETSLYRVIVYAMQNGCTDAVSNEVTINVYDDIAIDVQPLSNTICEGGSVNLVVVASGSPVYNINGKYLTDQFGKIQVQIVIFLLQDH